MKQTNLQLLKALTTLLYLSSGLCYHTTAVVDPERGLGLVQEKRVPGKLQNWKIISPAKKARLSQRGAHDHLRASSDTLIKVIPLLRELKRLLDSEDALLNSESKKKSTFVNMAKMATKFNPITNEIASRWAKEINEANLPPNPLRTATTLFFMDALKERSQRTRDYIRSMNDFKRGWLYKYIDYLFSHPENCFLRDETLRPKVGEMVMVNLRHIFRNSDLASSSHHIIRITLKTYDNFRGYFNEEGFEQTPGAFWLDYSTSRDDTDDEN